MKKFLTLLLCVALLLTALFCASAESPEILGKPLEDFSVKTIDGGSFTLSEALKDHGMVLINLWATWCPPCEMEFPYMEEAYEQYSDRVAIIALSIEPEDTPDALREYVDAHGMTFPVGSDTQTNLSALFETGVIPTSVVVDRFGNVALVESGAQFKVSSFTALFDYFLADDYTETTVLDGFPSPKPVSGADEAALSDAANAEGGDLAFYNATDAATWPMLPTEDGAALRSGNTGVDASTAAVYTAVTSQEGDALAFNFRTSTEPSYDSLFIQVDGETVKSFSGEHDWTAWAVPLTAGDHEIAFGYNKNDATDEGDDSIWISNVRLATGAEAGALLSALPPMPVGDAFRAVAGGEGAMRVVFDDPSGLMDYYFETQEGWIVDGANAAIDFTLSPAEDPETVVVSTPNGSFNLAGTLKPDGSGYTFPVTLATDDYDMVGVAPGTTPGQLAQARTLLLFDGEGGAEAFLEYLAMYGIDVSWQYEG